MATVVDSGIPDLSMPPMASSPAVPAPAAQPSSPAGPPAQPATPPAAQPATTVVNNNAAPVPAPAPAPVADTSTTTIGPVMAGPGSMAVLSEPFYKQAPFWITVMLMPLVYIIVLIVLWPGSTYTDSTRVQVITAVLGLLALIGAFWLGTSLSSSRKDDALRAAASAPTTVVNNAAPINTQGTPT